MAYPLAVKRGSAASYRRELIAFFNCSIAWRYGAVSFTFSKDQSFVSWRLDLLAFGNVEFLATSDGLTTMKLLRKGTMSIFCITSCNSLSTADSPSNSYSILSLTSLTTGWGSLNSTTPSPSFALTMFDQSFPFQ